MKNMGTLDRILRTAIAVILGILILAGQITGVWAIILGIIAIVFLVTSAFATCPAYKVVGISTRREKPAGTGGPTQAG